jgi:hypothetical protein
MAFAYAIVNRVPLLPGNKRKADASPLYMIWGTYTNGAGDSGGVIDTEGTKVLFANVNNAGGAEGAQVQINTASDGQITITTTLDRDGEWFAIIRDKK